MWIKWNPNPTGRTNVGDCSVRAVAKALGISWDEAHILTAENARIMGNVQSANEAWGSVLREHGFERKSVRSACPDCFTIHDFCAENPIGLYVLGTGTHVVTAVDGAYFDTWDSGDEVPQYYWRRE